MENINYEFKTIYSHVRLFIMYNIYLRYILYIFVFSNSFPQKDVEESTPNSTFSAQVLLSKCHFPLKETRTPWRNSLILGLGQGSKDSSCTI